MQPRSLPSGQPVINMRRDQFMSPPRNMYATAGSPTSVRRPWLHIATRSILQAVNSNVYHVGEYYFSSTEKELFGLVHVSVCAHPAGQL